MKTSEFIKKYNPCSDGIKFAEKFETMSEVWEACERPDWLFWILENHAPLEKEQSVRLSITFAESCISNWNLDDDRPALAIQAAKNWLENPSEENQSAAWSVWSAARSAAWSAWSAAE